MVLTVAKLNVQLKIVKVGGYADLLKRFGLSETAFCSLIYKRKNLFVLRGSGGRVAIEKRVANEIEVEYV